MLHACLALQAVRPAPTQHPPRLQKLRAQPANLVFSLTPLEPLLNALNVPPLPLVVLLLVPPALLMGRRVPSAKSVVVSRVLANARFALLEIVDSAKPLLERMVPKGLVQTPLHSALVALH